MSAQFTDKEIKKLAKIKDVILNIYETGNIKRYKLKTVYDAGIVQKCYTELSTQGYTSTINTVVAEFFKKHKFTVYLEEDKINYYISI